MKKFNEIWLSMTKEQRDFMKDYIERQKTQAIEHFKNQLKDK